MGPVLVMPMAATEKVRLTYHRCVFEMYRFSFWTCDVVTLEAKMVTVVASITAAVRTIMLATGVPSAMRFPISFLVFFPSLSFHCNLQLRASYGGGFDAFVFCDV